MNLRCDELTNIIKKFLWISRHFSSKFTRTYFENLKPLFYLPNINFQALHTRYHDLFRCYNHLTNLNKSWINFWKIRIKNIMWTIMSLIKYAFFSQPLCVVLMSSTSLLSFFKSAFHSLYKSFYSFTWFGWKLCVYIRKTFQKLKKHILKICNKNCYVV